MEVSMKVWAALVPGGTVEARARRILQLAMAAVMTVVTAAQIAVGGVDDLPPPVILLDVAAVIALVVPWSRLPADWFAAVGLFGILGTFAGPLDDPLRARAILFSSLIGAGAVSRRTGVVVGAIGAIAALTALGRAEPVGVVVTATGALVVGVTIPALLATARPRHFGRRSVASAELSDHTAVLAHEVAAPIASIGAGAQMLVKQLQGHPAEPTARAIADEAKLAYALLESLTDLSAIEARSRRTRGSHARPRR
jgi:signal transduction histidine kinase